ncbi:MAG: hypothetical protein HQL49_07325 [Gammaproteobacteria bacterium]|nr:hypothetical protein [Gammaproteobacteria bacterium]
MFALRTLIASTLLLLTSLSCAGVQDFAIINKTGYTIDAIHVSPSHSENWGEDIMGQDILDDEETVNISFSSKGAESSVCKWDLMVIYSDGDKAIWDDLNLCEINSLKLYWDGKNSRAEIE